MNLEIFIVNLLISNNIDIAINLTKNLSKTILKNRIKHNELISRLEDCSKIIDKYYESNKGTVGFISSELEDLESNSIGTCIKYITNDFSADVIINAGYNSLSNSISVINEAMSYNIFSLVALPDLFKNKYVIRDIYSIDMKDTVNSINTPSIDIYTLKDYRTLKYIKDSPLVNDIYDSTVESIKYDDNEFVMALRKYIPSDYIDFNNLINRDSFDKILKLIPTDMLGLFIRSCKECGNAKSLRAVEWEISSRNPLERDGVSNEHVTKILIDALKEANSVIGRGNEFYPIKSITSKDDMDLKTALIYVIYDKNYYCNQIATYDVDLLYLTLDGNPGNIRYETINLIKIVDCILNE